MKPTIGRIVIYNTTEEEQNEMTKEMQMHGSCNPRSELPAIIVSVWNETCVNLKVIMDGIQISYWKTSCIQGDEPGQWNWPKIEK